MTDSNPRLDVPARLQALRARTADITPSASFRARLQGIPGAETSSSLPAAILRLAVPSLLVAAAASAVLFVAAPSDETAFDDDLASGVTMEISP
jgi:hypothetical protein